MCCKSKITLCMGPGAPQKPHSGVQPSLGSSRIKNMFLLPLFLGSSARLRNGNGK